MDIENEKNKNILYLNNTLQIKACMQHTIPNINYIPIYYEKKV